MVTNEAEAITYLFRSLRRLGTADRAPDHLSRDTTPTRQLLQACELVSPNMEYAVVTGSKGKGSTTAIMARLLEHLGHTVGMVTSPHLVNYRERIRVNGRAIPEADLVRIVNKLQPDIDAIEAGFTDQQYFSPQGLFLAVALHWFHELGVNVAVLEIGRGGRFDDMAVVPNQLSLFTPILMEHVRQLGPTLDRIAWHKAGIIKPGSYAYSVPQASEVLDVLEAEARAQNAEFAWIAPMDMGEYLGETEKGLKMRLGRYGEFELSLHGRYQVENATLAVQGAGNLHARLGGVSHGAREYVDAIRAGLADVRWPGRMHQLEQHPAIYLDGATTTVAVQAMLDTLQGRLNEPVVSIIATPVDRDFAGVYAMLAPVSKAIILTENHISPNVKFPDPEVALRTARTVHENVEFAPDLKTALDLAKVASGRDGTILAAVSLPVVGEAMQLYGFDFEQI